MRLMLIKYLLPIEAEQLSYSLSFFSSFLIQDLLSACIILCIAWAFALWLCKYPKWRFAIYALCLFLAALLFTANLAYFRIYKENFSWSILKKDTLGLGLLSSLTAEVDGAFLIQSSLWALFCLLWFFFGLFLCSRCSPYSVRTQLFSKPFYMRLALFSLFLFIFFALREYELLPSASIASKDQEKAQRQRAMYQEHMSNILFHLLLRKESRGRLPFRFTPLYKPYSSQSFDFFFNTDSIAQESASQNKTQAFIPGLKIARKRYNIVLYILESTSHQYLQKKLRNLAVLPFWQKLSKHAALFPKHYVQSPLSVNSLVSLLASIYSMPADIWLAEAYPDIPIASLPAILKKAGYRSAFLHTGNLDYAGQRAFLQKRFFDVLADIKDFQESPYAKHINWGMDDRTLFLAAQQFVASHQSAYAQSPYFLVLSPLTPHHPYAVPERAFCITQADYQKEDIAELAQQLLSSQKSAPFFSIIAEKVMPGPALHSFGNAFSWDMSRIAAQKQSPIAAAAILQDSSTSSCASSALQRYWNALHYADFIMGQIVQALERLPGGEETLFFILADHGEAFGQHKGNFNHPFYLYEENVHVPFMIYNKKLFPKGMQYKGISRHIDILPTILDVLGLHHKKKHYHQGLSLLEHRKNRIASFYTTWRRSLAGLRDASWKYIMDLDKAQEELYCLEDDPQESENLAKKMPDLSQRYRNYLAELLAYQRHFFETLLQEEINWWEEKDKKNY